ncbi:bcl-2-interacting killer [Genypterus blacodes]|uniref:bcl-2-interacting killer n=1 Tax=Genypterus blacodes TaxID=154954 RepID=UPI003F760EE9
MVEQIRLQNRVISFRAGPGEADAAILLNMNRRFNDRAARTIGRQLAVIGDRLDCERTSRQPTWLRTPLHMLRPAQALTRTIYRDLQNQFGGFQGLSAAVKAWIAATVPGQGIHRADTWAAWLSNLQPETCTGWTRGLLVTLALVATVSVCTALWVEWKG